MLGGNVVSRGEKPLVYKMYDRMYRSMIQNDQKEDEKRLNDYCIKNFSPQKQLLILNFGKHNFDSKIHGNTFHAHIDHFEDLMYLCHLASKIHKWMSHNENRQVLVHCPQNAEYVGLLLTCYKLYTGEISLTQEKSKGSFPSIWRYKKFFYHVLKTPILATKPLTITKINFQDYVPVHPLVTLKQSNISKFSSCKNWESDPNGEYRIDVENCTMLGDFILNFYENKILMFRFTFNTIMIPEKTNFLRVKRDQLDIMNGKTIPETFALKLWFIENPNDPKYKLDLEELFSKSPQYVKRREVEVPKEKEVPSAFSFFGNGLIAELKKKFFKDTQPKEIKKEETASPKRKLSNPEVPTTKEQKVEEVVFCPPIDIPMPPPMIPRIAPPPPPGLNLTPLKQKLIAKKSNLKSLHWTPLSGDVGKSLWSGIEPDQTKVDSVQLEQLFTSKPTTPRGTPQKGLLSPRGSEPVILSMNRARQIEIVIRQFKYLENPLQDIPKCIESLNLVGLTTEKVNGLMIMAPTLEEVENIHHNKNPDLTMADLIVVAISKVPRYNDKLRSMQYMLYLQNIEMNDVSAFMQTKSEALVQLRESKKWSKVLEMVLVIGNILNSGKKHGNARGFKLEILPVLTHTKSVDGKSNLMDFLVDCCKKEGIQMFYAELSGIDAGSKVTLDEIENEVRKLKEMNSHLQKEIKLESNETLVTLAGICECRSIKALCDLSALKDLYEDVLEYFGESMQKDSDFFTIIRNFIREFKSSLSK
jgi:hypothetical protein